MLIFSKFTFAVYSVLYSVDCFQAALDNDSLMIRSAGFFLSVKVAMLLCV